MDDMREAMITTEEAIHRVTQAFAARRSRSHRSPSRASPAPTSKTQVFQPIDGNQSHERR
uniref:Uncharacterized protein n=1 Tax=Globisporangium ultimum (strain ATCC 200006 / CBS 805.95 / DAOM BR144) TaxID=431595 RepID=K3WIZ0_GLOUD